MNVYVAFLKKELIESARTFKLFILLVIFLLFGIMNPVMAKLMPEILASVLPDGMSINLGEPTALDAWAQFFKNASQMGLIIFVILFGGIMSNEMNKGTLVNVLTKGLPRPIVILAKFTSTLAVWTLSYVLCFLATAYYTMLFWHPGQVENLILAATGLWLFGALLIACLILGGVLFNNNYGGLLLAFGIVAVTMLLSIAPKLQKYNPITLASQNSGLVAGQIAATEFYPAMILTAGLTLGFILLAVLFFNKKQV